MKVSKMIFKRTEMEKLKPLCSVYRETKCKRLSFLKKRTILSISHTAGDSTQGWRQMSNNDCPFTMSHSLDDNQDWEATAEQIKEMWHLYGMEFLWFSKRKETLSQATAGAWGTPWSQSRLTNTADSNNVEYCFSCFSCFLVKTPDKSNLRVKGLFQLTVPGYSPL